MRPETRHRVEVLVETLIALLDAADGDPDIEDDDPLEDNHDAEHDPAEWGVSDSGADQEYAEQLWFKRAFADYRHAKRDAEIRAAVTLTAD